MISTIMPRLKCYKGTEEELIGFQREHLTRNQVCSISPLNPSGGGGEKDKKDKKDGGQLFILWFWEVG